MKERAANFDRLARIYRALEFVAFGRDLERARFRWLDALADRRSILILGEGDGRFLERLLSVAPSARIHCVDASAAMLAVAASRISDSQDRARITFEQADARQVFLEHASYDAVVTLFFLDCFDAPEAEKLIGRLDAALGPGAVWLFADFALPESPLARWRARAWLALLYAFFRWETGLRTRCLPPAETSIRSHGFSELAAATLQAGLLRSVLFRRS